MSRRRVNRVRYCVFLAPLLALLSCSETEGIDYQETVGSEAEPLVGVSTLSFSASADSWTKSYATGSNFGTATEIWTDATTSHSSTDHAFLKFPVSGIPANHVVSKAILKVKSCDLSYCGSIDGPAVAKVSNSWTETGITWNNEPSVLKDGIADVGAVGVNSWVQYDVTQAFAATSAGPITNGDISFRLEQESSADGTGFDSRENSVIADRPVLEITYTRTMTFTPTADAVAVQSSDTGNGTSDAIWTDAAGGGVDGQYVQAFLKFNVSGIPSGQKVTGALLRLTVLRDGRYGTTDNGPGIAKASTNSWSESTLKWSNRPGVTGHDLDNIAALSEGEVVELPVTAAFSSQTNGEITFRLFQGGSADGSGFYSREAANYIDRPRLELTYGPVGITGGTLATNEGLKFLVAGDTQPASLQAAHDGSYPSDVINSILDKARYKHGVHFVMHTGDLTVGALTDYPEDISAQMLQFEKVMKRYNGTFFLTQGNHDCQLNWLNSGTTCPPHDQCTSTGLGGVEETGIKAFNNLTAKMMRQSVTSADPLPYYSFDVVTGYTDAKGRNKARFIVVADNANGRGEQDDWLDSQLTATDTDAQSTDGTIRWVIVIRHHHSGLSNTSCGVNEPFFATSIIQAHQVDLVIAGHGHTYRHINGVLDADPLTPWNISAQQSAYYQGVPGGSNGYAAEFMLPPAGGSLSAYVYQQDPKKELPGFPGYAVVTQDADKLNVEVYNDTADEKVDTWSVYPRTTLQ